MSYLARPSSCVALAGMSTSQTSRKVGGQHIHIDRLGGRAVNGHLFDVILFLFCTLLIVICCEHKVAQYFLVNCIHFFPPMILAPRCLHGGGARV